MSPEPSKAADAKPPRSMAICLIGLAAAIFGGLGVLLFAQAAADAVMPHGTKSDAAVYLLLGSGGVFVIGAIAFLLGGVGWLASAGRQSQQPREENR